MAPIVDQRRTAEMRIRLAVEPGQVDPFDVELLYNTVEALRVVEAHGKRANRCDIVSHSINSAGDPP
jgi:hypothetical protein